MVWTMIARMLRWGPEESARADAAFAIGRTVTLEFPAMPASGRNLGGPNNSISVRIEQATEASLIVAASDEARRLDLLPVGTPVTLLCEIGRKTHRADVVVTARTDRHGRLGVSRPAALKPARAAFRIDVSVPLSYAVVVDDRGTLAMSRAARTSNLSASGLYFESAERLASGARVAMKFRLPDDPEPLALEAVVARVTPEIPGGRRGYGLRFIDVSNADQRRLAAFVFQTEMSRRRSAPGR